MERTTRILARRLGALVLAGAALAPAHAETTACTVIASLPAMLDVPGHYCLEANSTQDFVDHAIAIIADNVVLDCNGHRIRNSYSLNNAVGVGAGNQNHVVIRNCVVDGFLQGINVITYSDGRGDGNSIVGNHVLNSRKIGIFLSGSHNVVADNRITRTTGNYDGSLYGIMLLNYGSGAVGNVLRNNVIADFKPSPPSGQASITEAIYIGRASNTVVEGNTISGLHAATGAWVHAIEAYGSQQIVTGNTVLAPPAPLPVPFDGMQVRGIFLYGNLPEDDLGNACADNVVGGFITNISGCVMSGNTEF
ncbi:MAG: NosD domain-containing protein [Arenimonas sp.]